LTALASGQILLNPQDDGWSALRRGPDQVPERVQFTRLGELADHRKPKGARHQLASILLVCAAAMLAAPGAKDHSTGARDADRARRPIWECQRSWVATEDGKKCETPQ
jgi:hypothetical protein